ncbi:MAG: hypothetical protein Q7J59_05785 [Elusimicrobiota bacterium]|nr:hypothetical protein [Elusimicrobiota bacterium]
MKKFIVLTAAVSVFALAGCGGAKVRPVGSQKVVEKSADKTPEWVIVPFFEDETTMYFSGALKGVGDYAVGLRQAKAEAMKNVAEAIETKAKTEFVQNTRGSNLPGEDLGRFVQDGIAMTADNVNISGLLPAESYYEKVEEVTEVGVKYFYNCSVLFQLPVQQYKEARNRAINGLASKAREENNKAAEEAAMGLLDKLQ